MTGVSSSGAPKDYSSAPDNYTGVASSGPPASPASPASPAPIAPVSATAPSVYDEEVWGITRSLAELAGKVARSRKDWQANRLSAKAKAKEIKATNLTDKAKELKQESSAAIEQANKIDKETVDFIVRNRKKFKYPLLAAGGYYLLSNKDENEKSPSSSSSSSSSKSSFTDKVIDAAKKYLSNTNKSDNSKVDNTNVSLTLDSENANSFGTARPRKMNPSFYIDFQNRKKIKDKEKFDKLWQKILNEKNAKSNSSNSSNSKNLFNKSHHNSASVQKRMIKKSSSKASISDDINNAIDFINQYLTPNTNTVKNVSQKTKDYVRTYGPDAIQGAKKYGNIAVSEGKKVGGKAYKESLNYGQIAAREAEKFGRKAYGGAHYYGKQILDLIGKEIPKGGIKNSNAFTVSIPSTGFSQTINYPSMKDLASRAKTLGARKQTGRFDESTAVERALQAVRDWGESIIPTPKSKIKGMTNESLKLLPTGTRQKMKVVDGKLVPKYKDVPIRPKKATREDDVYSGSSINMYVPKSSMQVWDTATMKPASTWKPQKQVKDKMVYDPSKKRYVSTKQRDSNDITDFERYSDSKSVKKGINMTKGSMRARTRAELYGTSPSGGRAMMKSVSRMRSAGIEHLLGGYRGGKKMAKSSMSKRTRRITKNNPYGTPTPTAGRVIGPNGAMIAAQAGAMRGQPQNLWGNIMQMQAGRTMSPEQLEAIKQMEQYATPSPVYQPEQISTHIFPSSTPVPESSSPSVPPFFNQPKPNISDYESYRSNPYTSQGRGYSMQGYAPTATPPAKPPAYSFPKPIPSTNGAMQGAMQGAKTSRSGMGSGGTAGSMMKSVSRMRSAGTKHVVGGYRGGSRIHKAATPTLATRNSRAKYE
jgi:hypothetical protein